MRTTMFVGLVLWAAGASGEPLGSSFTFQGQLQQQGAPANGAFDLSFDLFDQEVAGVPVVAPVLLEDVAVANGLFTVELDFGVAPFAGEQLWLEVAVRPGVSTGGYSGLLPRHKLTANPYALHARTVAAGAVGSDEVDDSQVQLRVGQGCAAGSSIGSILADGTVDCETDDDTIVTSASALTSGTLSTNLYDAYADLAASGRLDNTASTDLLTRSQSDTRYINDTGTVTANIFQYDTDPTFRRNIPPSNFIATSPGDTWRLSADGSYRYCNIGQALPAGAESFAEVHLPAFATVTGFSCYFYDGFSSGDTTASANLRNRSLSSTGVSTMATASGATAGASTAVQKFSDSSIVSAIVSAGTVYWIESNFNTNSCNTASIRFYGCHVQYTQQQVAGN